MKNNRSRPDKEDGSSFDDLIEVLMAQPKSRRQADGAVDTTVIEADHTKEENKSQEEI